MVCFEVVGVGYFFALSRNANECRCVASCTAHIQELTEPEDRVRNMGEYFCGRAVVIPEAYMRMTFVRKLPTVSFLGWRAG